LVLFASTPQALAASGFWTLRSSPDMQAAFLARGSIAAGESYWHGVSMVAPGTSVTLRRAGETTRTYWSLDGVWRRERPERPVAVVAPAIRAAIVDSVRAHLVSDVPVAVFLSGGLDSAALATVARAETTGPLQSLTVTMSGLELDESRAARAAAERIGTTHTEVALDDRDRDGLLEEFVAALAQPSVDGFNTFLVARAARMAGMQVALSGVGGDELFGGYPSFTDVPRLLAAVRRWGWAARMARPLLSQWPSPRVTKFADVAGERPATLDEAWLAYRGVWSRRDVERLITSGTASHATRAARESTVPGADPFDVIRDNEWRHFLQGQLLPDADAVTMCRALELRTPLVDHVVLETVAAAGRWPSGTRPTWKAALFDSWPDWSPVASRNRPKQGFILPMDAWLRSALTTPKPRVWADVAARLGQPQYAGDVRRFLAGRLHWSRLWALYILLRMEARTS
jgi:asparagine synthase (glutamine-hydrolysing)